MTQGDVPLFRLDDGLCDCRPLALHFFRAAICLDPLMPILVRFRRPVLHQVSITPAVRMAYDQVRLGDQKGLCRLVPLRLRCGATTCPVLDIALKLRSSLNQYLESHLHLSVSFEARFTPVAVSFPERTPPIPLRAW